jgi:hypothetical protein
MIDATISNLEQPEQPPFYKYVVDPSPEAQERITLQAELDGGGDMAHKALDRLIELATANASAQVRAPAVWVLLQSKSSEAQEAVLRLVESRPDDAVVVSNALQAGLARERTARIRAALFAALMSSNGEAYASRIAHSWPELVDEAWHLTGDVRFLNALFEVLHPGSMEAAIEALAGPDLPDQMRFSMCYRLGYSTRPKDPSLIEATRRLVEAPQNSRADIARALLGWGEVDLALSVVGESLDQRSSTSAYLIMELIKRAPSAAGPLLIATLRRSPNADVIHALGCIDHPDSARELAPHLDGPLREDALLALEQLGTNTANAVLATRAADGDLEAARALARRRDARALQPLLEHIDGPHQRSAVIGLRDLRHHSANPLLARLASEEPDSNIAVIAAHGLVMTDREHARPIVEVLRQRKDPYIRQLADHWLKMLP